MKLLVAVLVAVAVMSSGTEAAPLSGTTYTDEGYSNSFEVVKLSDQPTGGTSRPFGPPAERPHAPRPSGDGQQRPR